MIRRLPALAALVFALILPLAAQAANPDAQNYRRAFALLDAGHAAEAYEMGARGRDPVLKKVLLGIYMAAPGNDIPFAEMADFARDNPDWPGLKDILAIAEQKIPSDYSPGAVINWFAAFPPVSLAGFYRYIDALDAVGRAGDAAHAIRRRWINGEFSDAELLVFYTRFGGFLTKDDNWARIDRLLWNEDYAEARRTYPFADQDMRATAEARIALAEEKAGAESAFSCVSGDWRADAGLEYERLRWLRRNNRDDEAREILDRAPENSHAEKWWEERNILARRAMEQKDYDLAYRLVADHHQVSDKTVTQAEFLAGWLALRFLNKPDEAKAHFQALYDHASTPISRARGAYWLGRTYEALGDRANAEQQYETAAALNITYYGQLATARLYAQPTISAKPEPAIPPQVRNKFFNRDLIRAVEHLADIGEKDRAHAFFHAAVANATERADFVLLSELAYQIRRPDYAIEAAKAAVQKNMLVAAGGFPVLGLHMPKPPEPALTHALIRQESMFNADAASPVGAQGLMQLMPRTAQAVARKLGLRFKQKKLCEPDYNLRLGTEFVQHQIDAFNGSYILALAAYNAGPGRVHEWLGEIGDPRDPGTDPVDWIELIPVPETRNYVQRIIENLQIYRARLNGGQAPLEIVQDLRR